ncbi:hypothetical protein H4R35_001328 [Dimargaris xerosporica]|nr:hypothetical protein H4R35_001328 [Dimargaris xerosporica]
MVKIAAISALILGLVVAAQAYPLADTQSGNVQAVGAHAGVADSRPAGAQLMHRQAGQTTDDQQQVQAQHGPLMRRQAGQTTDDQQHTQPPQGSLMRRQSGQTAEGFQQSAVNDQN